MSKTESWESTANILNALSSEKRVKTFKKFAEGETLDEIMDDIDISRSGIQHYIDDYKEYGLLRTEGKQYVVTEKGQQISEIIDELHTIAEEHEREQLLEEYEHIKQRLKEHGELPVETSEPIGESNEGQETSGKTVQIKEFLKDTVDIEDFGVNLIEEPTGGSSETVPEIRILTEDPEEFRDQIDEKEIAREIADNFDIDPPMIYILEGQKEDGEYVLTNPAVEIDNVLFQEEADEEPVLGPRDYAGGSEEGESSNTNT